MLRPATLDDLLTLRYWDAKAHVREATGADGGFDWLNQLPRSPSWREFLIYEDE